MTLHDEAAEKTRGIESKIVRHALVLVAQPPPLRRYRMGLSENCARTDDALRLTLQRRSVVVWY